MTRAQIEHTMRQQFRIWEGNPEAINALFDTCHALANTMHLDGGERHKFLIMCNAHTVDA